MTDELSANQVSIEKKQFMMESLEGIDKNGGKFEKTTKMRYVFIPTVIPFGDWDCWYIDNDLVWAPNPGQIFTQVTVPKGFVTDLASVPEKLLSFFPRTGRYAYAAIVHDFLYWDQSRSRDEADKVMAAAMEDAKVDSSTISKFMAALWLAGGKAWADNAKARTMGEKRVLAKFPTDRLTSWNDWRKQPDVFK